MKEKERDGERQNSQEAANRAAALSLAVSYYFKLQWIQFSSLLAQSHRVDEKSRPICMLQETHFSCKEIHRLDRKMDKDNPIKMKTKRELGL